MPSKNSLKIYIEKGYYHLYNRGVDKRQIFQDKQDYKVFLNYLKESLAPPLNENKIKILINLKGSKFIAIPRQPKNFYKKIDLLTYCLMPNHFHFFVKQNTNFAIREFMQSLLTRYSMFFNKKYKREGILFQGRYKGVLITNEAYFLHLSRYIHSNPSKLFPDLTQAYSSYGDYLGIRKTSWVKKEEILVFFNRKTLPFMKKINSYKDFVESYQESSEKVLEDLTLEHKRE